MFLTPNMGLTAWDLGVDPYDHSQLASNFGAIDLHDHDQAAGRGKYIRGNGIADNEIDSNHIKGDAVNPPFHIPPASIPQSRLADDSVGRPQLQDDAVGTMEIEDESVTLEKLAPGIMPIGMVVLWYRADSAVLPPNGWEVMDGRAWSTIPNSLAAGGTDWVTGNIPDMANKFALGSALAGTGSGPDLPPGIGSAGGQHERNLGHGHTSNAHSHTVDSHIHSIGADGSHNHRFQGTTPGGSTLANLFSRDVGVPRADGVRQALYLQGHNQGNFAGSDVALPMETVGGHTHGGTTGGNSAGTNSQTVTVNNGLTGDLDFRPAYVGLIYIMKVN